MLDVAIRLRGAVLLQHPKPGTASQHCGRLSQALPEYNSADLDFCSWSQSWPVMPPLLLMNPCTKSYCQSLQTDLSLGGPQIRSLMPSEKSCPQQYQPLQQHLKPNIFCDRKWNCEKTGFFEFKHFSGFPWNFSKLLWFSSSFYFNGLCLWHKIFSSVLCKMFYLAQNYFTCVGTFQFARCIGRNQVHLKLSHLMPTFSSLQQNE